VIEQNMIDTRRRHMTEINIMHPATSFPPTRR
jgi:hypothetical protein